jgi:hypothetical protein
VSEGSLLINGCPAKAKVRAAAATNGDLGSFDEKDETTENVLAASAATSVCRCSTWPVGGWVDMFSCTRATLVQRFFIDRICLSIFSCFVAVISEELCGSVSDRSGIAAANTSWILQPSTGCAGDPVINRVGYNDEGDDEDDDAADDEDKDEIAGSGTLTALSGWLSAARPGPVSFFWRFAGRFDVASRAFRVFGDESTCAFLTGFNLTSAFGFRAADWAEVFGFVFKTMPAIFDGAAADPDADCRWAANWGALPRTASTTEAPLSLTSLSSSSLDTSTDRVKRRFFRISRAPDKSDSRPSYWIE